MHALIRPLTLLCSLALTAGCGPSETTASPPAGLGPAPAVTDRDAASADAGVAPARTLSASVCVLGSGEVAESGSVAEGAALARVRVSARDAAPRTLGWSDVAVAGDAVAAWEACIESGAAVIVGPTDSAQTAALLPVGSGADVLWIIPQLGVGAVPTEAPNVVVVAEAPAEMGTVAATAALAGGSAKGVTLTAAGEFGASIATAFSAAYAAVQKPTSLSADLATAGAFGAAAAAAVADGADAILVVGGPDAATAAAAALGDLARLWVIDWGMQPEVLTGAPEGSQARIHGLNFALPRGVFEAEYLDAHERPPTAAAGLGYDAVMLAAEALEAAPELTVGSLRGALVVAESLPSAFGEGAVEERGGVLHFTPAHRDAFVAVRGPDGAWGFSPTE